MKKKNIIMIILITIITLLLVISIVLSIFNNNNKEIKILSCNDFINEVSSAATKYINENRNELDNYKINDYEYKIYADVLISDNYLSPSIINPFTGENIDASKIGIKILLTDLYEIEKITIVNVNGIEIDCKDSSTFDFSLEVDDDESMTSDDEVDGSLNSSSDVPVSPDNDNQDEYVEGVSPGTNADVEQNEGKIPDEDNNEVSGNVTREIIYVNKFPEGAYCAQAIDEFYHENGTTYYFTCQMSQYIYVIVDGVEYGLVEALENGIVTIEEVEAAKGSKFMSKSNNLSSY